MGNPTNEKVDLLLFGGQIVTESSKFKGQLAIKNGKIHGIYDLEDDIKATRKIDMTNKTIIPGVIDSHVHFCKPSPNSYKKDYYHETQAAAAGGITTVIEMPLSIPPVIDKKSFNLKLDTHKNEAFIDFGFWGAVIPYSIKNIEELHEAGCLGFKGFMAPHDKYSNIKNHDLLEAMKKIAEIDNVFAIHAEDEDLIRYFTEKYQKKAENNGEIYAKTHPIISEIEAIRRVLLFAKETGCRTHIVHLSCVKGAQFIKEAKEDGVDISVETCPHYLRLDLEDLKREGIYAKCEPPLRTRDNVEELWEYVKDGTIDYIASDHSSFTDERRKGESEDIWEAPPGLAGLETLLPIMMDEGVYKRDIGLKRLVQLTSTNVAKRFGIYPQKGSLKIGSDADLTILDLNETWDYTGADSFAKTKSTNNPYEGSKFKGRIKYTIVRGNIVYKDHEIIGSPGWGNYVYKQNLNKD